jgi:Cu2+-exporting ATPase
MKAPPEIVSAGLRQCRHCATLFDPPAPQDEFCCGGCAFVHNLILENGLDRYYEFKGDRVGAPVKSSALQRRDYSWLAAKATGAEATAAPGKPAVLDLAVQGISCVGCVWLMEKVLLRSPGVLRARVRAHPGSLHLEWVPAQSNLPALADDLRKFGYLLGPAEANTKSGSEISGRLGLCGAFAMNAMAFSLPGYLGMESNFALAGIFSLVAGISATLAVLTGGSYFISRAVKCLQSGVLHMDLPIAIGILAAYAGSLAGWMLDVESLVYFDFVAVFTFLMLAGRRLQLAAVERNRGRLLGLTIDANPLRDPADEQISLESLKPGTRYLVASGQIVPVASRLVSGHASISLESINGEPEPRHFAAGSRLGSGSLNIGDTALDLEAIEPWAESVYRKLREAGETATGHPALDRILRRAVTLVVLLAVIGFVGWWAGTGDLARALQVMISVLVVSCPCALGVAIPLADDLSAARVERRGVFVRRPAFWSRLRRVRHVIFDKTGTLTLESPVLENPEALKSLKAPARLALATMVFESLHPVSRSLTETLAMMGDTRCISDTKVTEAAGQGLMFTDTEGARWTLGRPGWQTPGGPQEGTVFACDGIPLAHFRFRDCLRPDAAAGIAALKDAGMTPHLLSGDHSGKVEALAATLSIAPDNAHGSLTPQEKETIVRCIDERNSLYIGDGINDSLAFSAASCTGTPVVDKGILESKADFYFLGRSLSFLARLFETAGRRARAVQRVAAFAIAYNLVAAGMSLAGMMNPLVAAVIMPLSGLITLGIVAMHFTPERKTPPARKE